MGSIERAFAAIVLVGTLLTSVAVSQDGAAVRDRAETAYRQRDFVRSAELYLEAARLDTDGRAELLFNAGCAFALAGRTDAAFAALESAGDAGNT